MYGRQLLSVREIHTYPVTRPPRIRESFTQRPNESTIGPLETMDGQPYNMPMSHAQAIMNDTRIGRLTAMSQSIFCWQELTEAQLTSFTQRMANLDVPVIQLEMPPHQVAVVGRLVDRLVGGFMMVLHGVTVYSL